MSDEWQVIKDFISRSSDYVDVKRLVNRLGIAYVERPANDGESGGIAYDGLQYMIWVNEAESAVRKRFTAAHELAHFLLHRDLLRSEGHMDRLFDLKKYDNPESPFSRGQETEANAYAAAILMPRVVLETQINDGIVKLSQLASNSGVSVAAMRIRLKNLGLDGKVIDDKPS